MLGKEKKSCLVRITLDIDSYETFICNIDGSGVDDDDGGCQKRGFVSKPTYMLIDVDIAISLGYLVFTYGASHVLWLERAFHSLRHILRKNSEINALATTLLSGLFAFSCSR